MRSAPSEEFPVPEGRGSGRGQRTRGLESPRSVLRAEAGLDRLSQHLEREHSPVFRALRGLGLALPESAPPSSVPLTSSPWCQWGATFLLRPAWALLQVASRAASSTRARRF